MCSSRADAASGASGAGTGRTQTAHADGAANEDHAAGAVDESGRQAAVIAAALSPERRSSSAAGTAAELDGAGAGLLPLASRRQSLADAEAAEEEAAAAEADARARLRAMSPGGAVAGVATAVGHAEAAADLAAPPPLGVGVDEPSYSTAYADAGAPRSGATGDPVPVLLTHVPPMDEDWLAVWPAVSLCPPSPLQDAELAGS